MKFKRQMIFVCALIVCSLSSCSKNDEKTYPSFLDSKISILSTAIHTEEQKYYIDSRFLDPEIAQGTKELSKPLPVKLEWIDYGKESYTLEFEDLTDGSDSYLVRNIKPRYYEFYNAEINTTYDVKLFDANNNLLDENVFKTEESILRNLDIDGVTNCRDIGGYTTLDGKTTAQGFIYRTARLNDSSTTEVKPSITKESKAEMLDHLKVKTEIDLRQTIKNENGGLVDGQPGVLGSKVKYVNAPMNYDAPVLKEENYQSIIKVFDILGNQDNYPVFFHCNIGTDRTGLIAYLINALCNIAMKDLELDYIFSNFANIGGVRKASTLTTYQNLIYECDGDTFAEQTYHFLTDEVGVPSKNIDTLLKILTN